MSKLTPEEHGIAKAAEVEGELNHTWEDTADYIEALEAVISDLETALVAAREDEIRGLESLED